MTRDFGKAKGAWYNGPAIGSFDDVISHVDLRGALPQFKLTLSAGGKEIECVCGKEAIYALADALRNRVRVYGRAIYSSGSPLPMRVEVSSIEAIKKDADLSRWRGAFRSFSMESWDVIL